MFVVSAFPCRKALLAALGLVFFLACGGRSTPIPAPVDRVTVVGYASTGVWLGTDIPGQSVCPNQALVWVDGQRTPLSPGAPSYAVNVARDGEDLYVLGGDEGADKFDRLVVWKNGAPHVLDSHKEGYRVWAGAITARGGKMAVGGNQKHDKELGSRGLAWVDGGVQQPTWGGEAWSSVSVLSFQQDGLRMAGNVERDFQIAPHHFARGAVGLVHQGGRSDSLPGGNLGSAVVAGAWEGQDWHLVGLNLRGQWKPGTAPRCRVESSRRLGRPDPRVAEAASTPDPRAFKAPNTDWEFLRAQIVHWKNGVASQLTDGRVYANVSGICVDGGHVYVSGLVQANPRFDKAVYWKDGMQIDLTQGKSEARTTGIHVIGGDVYICGYEVIADICVATLWKNGVAQRLGDGKLDSFAEGIVVERRF